MILNQPAPQLVVQVLGHSNSGEHFRTRPSSTKEKILILKKRDNNNNNSNHNDNNNESRHYVSGTLSETKMPQSQFFFPRRVWICFIKREGGEGMKKLLKYNSNSAIAKLHCFRYLRWCVTARLTELPSIVVNMC